MPKGIYKRTKKTKEKLSETQKKNPVRYWLGKHRSRDTKRKISKSHLGDKNPNWKGDKVKYRALHTWVRNNLGIPSQCKFCDRINEEVKIEWANKSGKYLRKLNDWIPLCRKCHRKYDKQKKVEKYKNYV